MVDFRIIKLLFVFGLSAMVGLLPSGASAQNISIDELNINLDGYTPPPELLAAIENSKNTGDTSLLRAALVNALIADGANAKLILKAAMSSNLPGSLDVFKNVFQDYVNSQPDVKMSVLSDIISGAVESGMAASEGDTDKITDVVQTIVSSASETMANSETLSSAGLSMITGSAIQSILAVGGDANGEASFSLVETVAGSAASGAIAGGGSPSELNKSIQASMAGIIDILMSSGATSDINVEELVSSANDGVQAGIVSSLGQNNSMTQLLVSAATSSIQEAVEANQFETASAAEPEPEVDGSQSVSPN